MCRSVLFLAVIAGVCFAAAPACPAFSETPPKEEKARPTIPTPPVRVGKPFLEMVRRYGRPSRIEKVQLKAQDPGVADQSGALWIYTRPTSELEVLIDSQGRVLQSTERATELGRYNIIRE